MKRVFTLLAGVTLGFYSFAQLSLGVQVTGNLSDASISTADIVSFSKSSKVLPGAGIVADFEVSPAITIRSGINFLQYGIKLKTSLSGLPGDIEAVKIKGSNSVNYLQIPLNALYTTSGSLKFYIGGGPFVSYGIGGKTKQTTTATFDDGSVDTEKEESDFFERDADGNTFYKRLDIGVGAVAGVKLPGGLYANIGYQYSLTNASRDDEEKYKNRGFQLSVGYFLWSK